MFTRIVWCSHAYCDDFPHVVWFWHAQMRLRHCDFNTHKSDLYTQSVMLIHMSVIMTHTCWNHSCVWCSHAYCNFNTHECDFNTHECDLYMQSAISIRRVWFLHAECDFYTQCDFYTLSVMLRRMSVIMTLTKVIMTLIRVKTTLCV
jgi:hypothetical protein